MGEATKQNIKGARLVGARELRSLANLGATASSCRVLNLAHVSLVNRLHDEYHSRPLFKHTRLNRAIFVKHTLRANERDVFAQRKRTATKIILPFDWRDLKLGGQYIFVNQIGFKNFVSEFFNTDDSEAKRDLTVLELMDGMPSLDPFLLREQLSRHGMSAAPCYLKISPNDIMRMTGFANAEVERLVKMASDDDVTQGMDKLTTKILSDQIDRELAPLKACLRMNDEEFSEGIFSWRGFLYFKWSHAELQYELQKVLNGLHLYQPVGRSTAEERDKLNSLRPRLARTIIKSIEKAGHTLRVYDKAYNALIYGQDPLPFRQFLRDGPALFFELGERIGILNHISSFWAYRMQSESGPKALNYVDYADLLSDFAESLNNQLLHTDDLQTEFVRPRPIDSDSAFRVA